MVTHQGIEAKLEKIQSIREMKELETLHVIQHWEVAALSKFLSSSAEISLPFLNLLRGVSLTKKMITKKEITWDQDWKQAFQQLKLYLETVPLLTCPSPGEVLLLYMVVTPEAGSSMLIREKEGSLLPNNHVSNNFKNTYLRYSGIVKVGYTLLLEARRVRPYF